MHSEARCSAMFAARPVSMPRRGLQRPFTVVREHLVMTEKRTVRNQADSIRTDEGLVETIASKKKWHP